MKLLIVDDNRDNVELMSQILEDKYETIKAYNGPECIKKAKEEQPDLIILDVMMPEMNGYEVMKRLQKDKRTREIPVIFLTAHYKDADRIIRGMKLGAFDYITKPVEEAVLMVRIEKVISIKQAEGKLKSLVNEKELLLKEINHRVKNNLQLILSILNLQSKLVNDKKAEDVIKDIQKRIHSIYLIHNELIRLENLSDIDIKYYISRLVSHLDKSFRVDESLIIKIEEDVNNVVLNIDKAIPCGMIVNELVSNVFQHAFPAEKKGTLRIAMHAAGKDKYELTISDNGIGFPKGLDFRNTESLGMQLVIGLVSQLNGSIELKREGGTTFKIII